MHTLLLHVFEQLEREKIEYCVIRGYEELESVGDKDDIDLLVKDTSLDRLAALLKDLDFVRLPVWGHAPHYFFVTYDEATDQWLKLDVVTTVMYGQPTPTLATNLADGCLNRRQRRGVTFVPAPEDELVTLLLHCLLDKGAFAPHRLQRIQQLRHEIADEAYLNRLLRAYLAPDMTWARLAALIDSASWPALLGMRAAIARRLARGQRGAALARRTGNWWLRKLDRVAGVFQPRSLTVALLAPDGGGKTTLANELAKRFFLPSRYIYMGSNVEASTVGLPTTRWIESHAQRTAGAHRSPGWLIARGLRFPNNLLEQWYRYGMSYYHMIRGRLVLFDRYVYDAPGEARKRSLKSRLRGWLLRAIAPEPNLVVFLDAPGEMLFARKGEHSPAILEQQRQHYLSLRAHLPQMVIVDATANADQVRRNVTSIIWRWYGRRTEPKAAAEHVAFERGIGES
jgi:thymidylate kinase